MVYKGSQRVAKGTVLLMSFNNMGKPSTMDVHFGGVYILVFCDMFFN